MITLNPTRLRPYQTKAVEFVDRTPESALIVAPTGSGKSLMSLSIAESLIAQGYTVIYTAHLSGLVTQFADRVNAAKIRHQLRIGNDKPYNGASLILSAVQSLARWDQLPGLLRSRKCAIIWDEWHESFFWDVLVSRIINVPVRHIGLTATPWRLDGAESWNGEWSWHECASYSELVQSGNLCPIEYRCVVPKPVISAKNREFTAAEKKAAVAQFTPDRVFEIWGSNGGDDGVPTLAFCPSIAYSNQLAEYWRYQGINATSISCETPDEERRTAIRRFKGGDLTLLASPQVLRIGFDAPNAVMGLGLNHTNALDLIHQSIGRLSRPHHSKSNGVWVDFTGGVLLFEGQLPEQIESWREVEQPIGRVCESCDLSNKRAAKICIRCKSKLPAKEGIGGVRRRSGRSVTTTYAVARMVPTDSNSDPVDVCRYELALAFAAGRSPESAIERVKSRYGKMPSIRSGSLVGSIFVESSREAAEIYRQHLDRLKLKPDRATFYLQLEFGRIV